MRSQLRVWHTLVLCFLLFTPTRTPALYPNQPNTRGTPGRPLREEKLAGLVVQTSTLGEATRLHGAGYFVSPDDPDEYVWYDETRSIYLSVYLSDGYRIRGIILSRTGAKAACSTNLDHALLVSGKGLRLGEQTVKARKLYGQPNQFIDPARGPYDESNWVTWRYDDWSKEAEKDPVPVYFLISYSKKDKRIQKMELWFGD